MLIMGLTVTAYLSSLRTVAVEVWSGCSKGVEHRWGTLGWIILLDLDNQHQADSMKIIHHIFQWCMLIPLSMWHIFSCILVKTLFHNLCMTLVIRCLIKLLLYVWWHIGTQCMHIIISLCMPFPVCMALHVLPCPPHLTCIKAQPCRCSWYEVWTHLWERWNSCYSSSEEWWSKCIHWGEESICTLLIYRKTSPYMTVSSEALKS